MIKASAVAVLEVTGSERNLLREHGYKWFLISHMRKMGATRKVKALRTVTSLSVERTRPGSPSFLTPKLVTFRLHHRLHHSDYTSIIWSDWKCKAGWRDQNNMSLPFGEVDRPSHGRRALGPGENSTSSTFTTLSGLWWYVRPGMKRRPHWVANRRIPLGQDFCSLWFLMSNADYSKDCIKLANASCITPHPLIYYWTAWVPKLWEKNGNLGSWHKDTRLEEGKNHKMSFRNIWNILNAVCSLQWPLYFFY